MYAGALPAVGLVPALRTGSNHPRSHTKPHEQNQSDYVALLAKRFATRISRWLHV